MITSHPQVIVVNQLPTRCTKSRPITHDKIFPNSVIYNCPKNKLSNQLYTHPLIQKYFNGISLIYINEENTNLEPNKNRLGVLVKQSITIPGTSVQLVISNGSVIKFSGDAIVNATNTGGVDGGGIDGAINEAGGVAFLDHRNKLHSAHKKASGNDELIPTGDALTTTSGNRNKTKLKCKWVIHAVGPQYDSNPTTDVPMNDALLASSYKNSLEEAKKKSLKTIAFSLISSGIFKGDQTIEHVLQIGIDSIIEWIQKNKSTSIKEIHMVGFKPPEVDALLSIIKSINTTNFIEFLSSPDLTELKLYISFDEIPNIQKNIIKLLLEFNKLTREDQLSFLEKCTHIYLYVNKPDYLTMKSVYYIPNLFNLPFTYKQKIYNAIQPDEFDSNKLTLANVINVSDQGELYVISCNFVSTFEIKSISIKNDDTVDINKGDTICIKSISNSQYEFQYIDKSFMGYNVSGNGNGPSHIGRLVTIIPFDNDYHLIFDIFIQTRYIWIPYSLIDTISELDNVLDINNLFKLTFNSDNTIQKIKYNQSVPDDQISDLMNIKYDGNPTNFDYLAKVVDTDKSNFIKIKMLTSTKDKIIIGILDKQNAKNKDLETNSFIKFNIINFEISITEIIKSITDLYNNPLDFQEHYTYNTLGCISQKNTSHLSVMFQIKYTNGDSHVDTYNNQFEIEYEQTQLETSNTKFFKDVNITDRIYFKNEPNKSKYDQSFHSKYLSKFLYKLPHPKDNDFNIYLSNIHIGLIHSICDDHIVLFLPAYNYYLLVHRHEVVKQLSVKSVYISNFIVIQFTSEGYNIFGRNIKGISYTTGIVYGVTEDYYEVFVHHDKTVRRVGYTENQTFNKNDIVLYSYNNDILKNTHYIQQILPKLDPTELNELYFNGITGTSYGRCIVMILNPIIKINEINKIDIKFSINDGDKIYFKLNNAFDIIVNTIT